MQSETAARDQFVEEMGIFIEEAGLPRMAGRVLGLLLVCDPPHLSAPEIGEMLGASKGSVSTTTRMLMSLGFVERVGIPHRRQGYFRVRAGVWQGLLATQVSKVKAARVLAERGLRSMRESGSAGDGRLEEMRDLYAFLERELPLLLERWETEQMNGASAGETLPATSP
jgi:DNA-binding transcriptional regulator GbsR (MarR family)